MSFLFNYFGLGGGTPSSGVQSNENNTPPSAPAAQEKGGELQGHSLQKLGSFIYNHKFKFLLLAISALIIPILTKYGYLQVAMGQTSEIIKNKITPWVSSHLGISIGGGGVILIGGLAIMGWKYYGSRNKPQEPNYPPISNEIPSSNEIKTELEGDSSSEEEGEGGREKTNLQSSEPFQDKNQINSPPKSGSVPGDASSKEQSSNQWGYLGHAVLTAFYGNPPFDPSQRQNSKPQTGGSPSISTDPTSTSSPAGPTSASGTSSIPPADSQNSEEKPKPSFFERMAWHGTGDDADKYADWGLNF